MKEYEDIMGLSRPVSGKPSMSAADRAKIFMPFAALKGYEEAIEEKSREVNDEYHKPLSSVDELYQHHQ